MSEEKQWPLSVTEATKKAKEGFEQIRLTIEGEISEFKNNRGYKSVFFTIKDEHAVLYCKMWRNQFEAAEIEVDIGSLVRITGKFTIWAEKGDIKFEASSIAYAGEGALRARVAKLERELRLEGLFDPSRKKALPLYPERIGLVTSARGAVVHDVLRTLREGYPLASVYFAGVPVEGKEAPQRIIEGMRELYRNKVEVILLVVGGGSFEHLMAFNDEQLVRAMAKCPIPIVTGIGHERDNFLADLAADLRCTSPTKAAAEIGPSFELIKRYHASYLDRMNNATRLELQHDHLRLEKFESRPVFCDPAQLYSDNAQHIDYQAERLEKNMAALSVAFTNDLQIRASRLHDLSPLGVMARGYSIARSEEGKAILKAAYVSPESKMKVQFSDGVVHCEVESVLIESQLPFDDSYENRCSLAFKDEE